MDISWALFLCHEKFGLFNGTINLIKFRIGEIKMNELNFALNIVNMIKTDGIEEQLITAALITITIMPLFILAVKMIAKELTEV